MNDTQDNSSCSKALISLCTSQLGHSQRRDVDRGIQIAQSHVFPLHFSLKF